MIAATSCITCPRCAFDLEALKDIEMGDLLSLGGGAAIYWKSKRLKLGGVEPLALQAILRAGGAALNFAALCEATGYEGERNSELARVYICRLRKAFRSIDPTFDRLETGVRDTRGSPAVRWRVEEIESLS